MQNKSVQSEQYLVDRLNRKAYGLKVRFIGQREKRTD